MTGDDAQINLLILMSAPSVCVCVCLWLCAHLDLMLFIVTGRLLHYADLMPIFSCLRGNKTIDHMTLKPTNMREGEGRDSPFYYQFITIF